MTSRITLFEFVQKYDQALSQIVKNEQMEDFITEHKRRVVDPGRNALLYDAAQIYTRNIWVKFKDEFDRIYDWRVSEGEQYPDYKLFHVTTKESVKHPQQFLVQFNPITLRCTCQCQKFQFSGMICRHILKLLVRCDVDKIPEALIHRRWKKGANKFRGVDRATLIVDDGNAHVDALRLNHMTQEMTKLACTCAPYKETYVIFMENMHETSRKVGIAIDSLMSRRAIEEAATQKVAEENARVDKQIANAWGGSRGADAWGGSRGADAWGGSRGADAWGGSRGADAWGGSGGGSRGADAWGGSRGADAWGGSGLSIGVSASNDPDLRDSSTPNVSSSQFKILDPNVSQTKGRKKGREVVGGSSRMKSGLEMATKKNKRMCRSCHKLSRHDSRNCPLKAMGRNRDLVASSSDDPDVLMEEDGDNRDE
ncbi:hypothetical protein Dimus_011420 [Dionaea muscipula]